MLGIRGFTDEFRHGTIITTLLASGTRVRVLGAKVAVSAVAAVVIAFVAEAVMTGAALLLSSSEVQVLSSRRRTSLRSWA